MSNNRAGGSFLKRKRLEHRLTMQDVERALGIAPSYISRIENARFPTGPDYAIVTRLADFYGVTPNELAQAYQVYLPRDTTDIRLRTIVAELQKLPDGERGRALELIEMIIMQARSHAQEI
jgi:transcriptional regulator with XRE-family HTH domain